MNKAENVFIKLQIEKDKQSGGLMLTINFDNDAPNFSIDTREISWSPTFEELDFIIETFEIISKRKKQEEIHIEETNDNNSTKQTDIVKEKLPEKKIISYEPLKGDFNSTNSFSDSFSEKHTDEKEIFVQVDDKTIDEALKRNNVNIGEALILDEEDKNIIDRMLKKRIKIKDKD